MNANRYMRDSLRTADRSNMDRLKLECALGLCGEAGEVAEQVKKHFFHGHELDKRQLKMPILPCWMKAVPRKKPVLFCLTA